MTICYPESWVRGEGLADSDGTEAIATTTEPWRRRPWREPLVRRGSFAPRAIYAPRRRLSVHLGGRTLILRSARVAPRARCLVVELRLPSAARLRSCSIRAGEAQQLLAPVYTRFTGLSVSGSCGGAGTAGATEVANLPTGNQTDRMSRFVQPSPLATPTPPTPSGRASPDGCSYPAATRLPRPAACPVGRRRRVTARGAPLR